VRFIPHFAHIFHRRAFDKHEWISKQTLRRFIMQSITKIIATGSVDGILTTAALLRVIGNLEISIVFAQAFTVDQVDVSTWEPKQQVAFVDLAVNNREKSMTIDFVRRIREGGHEIIAVCDEHCREDWLEVLGSFDELLIEPQSQSEGVFKSSGAVLKAALGGEQDFGTTCLCDVADAADRMEFTGSGELVNKAVKSKIQDDTRRVYLARYFAQYPLGNGDEVISGWIGEYNVILTNHQEIIDSQIDLGDGIIRIYAVGKTVDMTTLMSQLYKTGAKIVVCEGEMFNKAKGCKTRQIAFGTNEKFDLLTCIKQVVTASGFASKANVEPEDEVVALGAVRELVNPKPVCPYCKSDNCGYLFGVTTGCEPYN
jgi:hypothetical protein